MVCSSCSALSKSRPAVRRPRNPVRNDFFLNNMSYKWADPTWHFFHSLGGMINKEFYKVHALEILNMVRSICRVLPCPHCQQHAGTFFKHVKYTNYTTKESFRQLMLAFHNDVNRRTNKPILHRSYLDKYERSNFIQITKLFLNTLKSYRSTLGGGFSDTRGRDAMRTSVKAWVNKYYMYLS